jgi:hypothetical protein
MALDFPASPTLGATLTGPGGVIWQWDGAKWFNATGSQPAGVIIAASPPTANPGQQWWDSVGGQLYIRYDDGNGPAQWVPSANVTGLANAATTMDVDKALGNVGRNLIHNSGFTIAQRGAGPFTVSGVTLDRWSVIITTDTVSIGQATTTAPDRVSIGDEAANGCLQNTFTGNAAAGAFHLITQRIEDVRRLTGKTVLVSFYAAANATLKLGVNALQSPGTGGSPTGGGRFATGTQVTITNTFARYTVPFTLPSLTTMTLGTNNDHYTGLEFWFSAGATNTAIAGNVGVQSGIVKLWGIQLEVVQPGQTVPSKLEKRDPVLELQQCQRFYQVGALQLTTYVAAATGIISTMLGLPVTMRSSTISITTNWATQTNASGPTLLSQSPSALLAYCSAVAVGNVSLQGSFTASADL